MNEPTKYQSHLSTADLAGAADRPTPTNEDPRLNRGGAAAAREQAPAPLFNQGQSEDLRKRWNDLQTAFVDDPRSVVKQADELVASTMKQLAEMFSRERSTLEQQWDQGDKVSTEDLRVALQRYRSFFNRLLNV